jgi:ABC-type antimicrobial peptide transport system permease subunit
MLKMIMDEALHVLLVGLLAGVFLAAIGERLIDARMPNFLPNEISTWVVVLFLILTVGLVAALIPARRAAGIDPNVALRDL